MDFGPDGDLYVVEMVKSGVFNFFIGADEVGRAHPRRLGDQGEDRDRRRQLTTPGGVSVARNGTIYVTNHSVSSTDGEVLRIPQ